MAETYVVKALNFDGRTSVEITVFEPHPTRGRVATGKRLRIRTDAVLDVAMLMIEAHSAIRGLVVER